MDAGRPVWPDSDPARNRHIAGKMDKRLPVTYTDTDPVDPAETHH